MRITMPLTCVSFCWASLFLRPRRRAAFAQNAPAQPIWGVNCAGTPGGLDCRAVQSLPMSCGQATVAVRILPNTKKPSMFVLVPLGIYLPAGLTVQFGQDAPKKVALHNCDSAGCLAEYALADDEIAAMAKGQSSISVQDTISRRSRFKYLERVSLVLMPKSNILPWLPTR